MLKFEPLDQHEQDLLKNILRHHFAFTKTEILENIQSDVEYIDVASGDTLLRQGEHSDDVYFVLSGRLRALREDEAGVVSVLGEIARGETIGELALFTGEPRSASIVALRNSLVVKLTRATIEDTISKDPQIGLQMTRLVIERFRRRENERHAPVVPITVCILPITPGLDAVAFAEKLQAAQPPADLPVVVITGDDIAQRFGNGTESPIWRPYGAVAEFIDRVEAESRAIYLAADGSDTPWTRFCLQHADEILLLADARGDGSLSELEQHAFADKAPLSIARQTLVLLHDAATRSPRSTARWLDVRHVARHVHIRPELPRDMRRMARIISGRGIGLVLAGGGAKGFAHIGVMKALEEAGIEVDFVGGTSIGAVMGMVLAMDVDAGTMATAVHRAFLRHPKGNITGDYNFIPLVSLIKGLRSHGALRTAVHDIAGADVDTEDTWKNFFAIASNFSTGSEAVLSRGNLIRNVIASYAIPGALPPVFIGGNMMFDGGTFNNFPVDVMAQSGAGRIIGVDLSTDHGRTFDLDRLPGTLALLRDKLRPRDRQLYQLPSIPETLLESSFITSIPKQKAARKFVDLLFQPPIADIGLLDWKHYEDIVAIGYRHAKEVIANLSGEKAGRFR